MIKSGRSGFIRQAFEVTPQSKSGTFTDEPTRGYETLISLAAANNITMNFSNGSTQTFTLELNTEIAFADVASITSSGNILIS